MIELVRVMGAIALTWTISGAATWGMGAALWRWMGGALDSAERVLLAYWLGLAAVIGGLQVWHLFAPVNGASMVLWLLLGAVGLVAHRAALWRVMASVRRYPSAWLVFGVIAVMAANNALLEPKRYDAGLYQIQSVMWTNTYPIVPGLGNLHGRLGFNNAFHLYIAQLNTGILAGRGMHLANGLPLLMWAAGAVLGLWRTLTARRLSVSAVYWALMMPLALRHLFTVTLYSPDNDLMALLVGVVMLGVLLDVLTAPDVPDRDALLMAAGLLAGVGVTFKLSFAILGGAMSVTLLALHIIDRRPLARPLIGAVAGGLALVGAWMARGVMMTGYVAYPSTFGAFPVDWRMPPVIGQQEAAWVRAWARMPGVLGDTQAVSMPQIDGLSWVIPWLFDTFTTTPNLFDVTLPLGLTAGALAVKLWRRDGFSRGWLALLPLVAALVAWWWIAPSPRFAGATFWGFAGATLALLALETPSFVARRVSGGAIAVALLCALVLPVQLRVVFPAKDTTFYTLPEAVIREHTSERGAVYWEPTTTDQCWDAPLPCAYPYSYTAQLCEREAGNIAAGYAMGGVQGSRCDVEATP